MDNIIAFLFDPKSLPYTIIVSIYTLIVVPLTREIKQRYCTLLKAAPGDSNWDSLVELRAIQEEGGTWAQWYNRYLRRLLGGFDWLFGDADEAERSLSPRFFGLLNEKAPLWTARGYDRCLLLALIYPVLSVIFCWAIWKTQGTAEPALGLGNISFLHRLDVVAALAAPVPAGVWMFRESRVDGSIRRFLLSLILFDVAGAGALAGAGAVAGAFTVAVAVAGAFAGVVAGAGAGAIAVAVAVVGAVAGALAGAIAVAVAVFFIQDMVRRYRREGIFLLFFSVSLTLACIALPIRLVHWTGSQWHDSGALLIFLGLLPLLNAPFDWISIGITRGLLRLGLQIKAGPVPYLLALIDLGFSLLWLFVLVAAMVWGIQLFNLATQIGGGKIILDLHQVFLRLEPKHRADPENYWIYFTLLTTLLPSICNVTIAAASFGSNIPPLRRYILDRIHPTNGVEEHERQMVAAALTVPWLLALIGTPIVWLVTLRILCGEDGVLSDVMLAWARLLSGDPAGAAS